MDTLVYLLYGKHPEYHLELTYSILSAFRFLRIDPEPRVRIVLMTEAHNARTDLPVINHTIADDEMKHWQLDGAFHFAARTHAARRALETYGGRVIMMDADTVYRVHPAKLFEKVGPGRGLLHASENTLEKSPERADWEQLFAKAGGSACGYPLHLQLPMYNSGVVGLHESAIPLLSDVLALVTELYPLHPIFTVEQFASSLVFTSRLEVSTCEDEVKHYWGAARRYYRHQIEQVYPKPDPEHFKRLAESFPELRELPRTRVVDAIAGRLMRLRRGDTTYAFAWQAYRSALTEGRAGTVIADIWAGIALDVLTYGVGRVSEHTFGDFAAFAPDRIDGLSWMAPSTRDRWHTFWKRAARHTS